MSNKLVIKTNENDWIEIYMNDNCIWQDHYPPMNAYKLQDFLDTVGVKAEIEVVEEFD